MLTKQKETTQNTIARFQTIRYPLILGGILVGILAGLVAVLYRIAIDKSNVLLHYMLGLGAKDIKFALLWFAILIGAALIVGKLVDYEGMISGSGIPQVEGELHGLFDPNWVKVLFCKFIGGVLAVGAGLSLGREGPSIQLGAMVAKGFSKLTHRIKIEEKLLMTCGAGAGLAAAFNAPLAGVLFALEELHKNFSSEVILSTMSACVAADFVSRQLCGLDPIFSIHNFSVLPLQFYWILTILGVGLGVVGAFYNFCLNKSQEFYKNLPFQKKSVQMLIPFLCAGILGFTFPYVLGGGHELIEQLAKGEFLLPFIFVVFVVKFIFSMVSFGSGAPGGIFLPLLVLGALLGGLCASIATTYLGVSQLYFQNFVVLAMAGFFAAIVKAPITGIVLICEMTGSFSHLLSLSLVSLLAYITSDLLKAKPVYEQLLNRILNNKNPNQAVAQSSAKILLEIPIHHGCRAQDQKIKDIPFPKDCLIVSILHGGREVIPKGGTKIHAGDNLIVLVAEEKAYYIKEELTHLCQTL